MGPRDILKYIIKSELGHAWSMVPKDILNLDIPYGLMKKVQGIPGYFESFLGGKSGGSGCAGMSIHFDQNSEKVVYGRPRSSLISQGSYRRSALNVLTLIPASISPCFTR
jgi:hypothetical protein